MVWTRVRFLCLIVFVSVLATNNNDECYFQLLSFVWDTYIPTPQGTDFFYPYVMQILKQKYIFKDLFITHHLRNLQRFVKKPLKLPEYQIPNSEKKRIFKKLCLCTASLVERTRLAAHKQSFSNLPRQNGHRMTKVHCFKITYGTQNCNFWCFQVK